MPEVPQSKSLFKRAARIRRERGFIGLIKKTIPFFYNRLIWPLLPKGDPRRFNKIPVAHTRHRWLDSVVPWPTPSQDHPEYEAPLIESLRQKVTPGDDIVVIGGGHGVSTVVAASLAGKEGSVTVYEGSDERIEAMGKTFDENGVSAQIKVVQAVVGNFSDHAEAIYGKASNADMVSPEELPECDILELDCEGAEQYILDNITIRPRVIIVETHDFLNAPTNETANRLMENGYDIIDCGVEEEDLGVYVLTAIRRET